MHEFIERTRHINKSAYVKLPEDLEQACQKYMGIMGHQRSNKGHVKIKLKLTPNCPGLVLAFYKHESADLHDHLHRQLGILFWSSDQNGMTAFHLAVIEGEFDALKRLLRKSPDGAHKKNKDNKTPYELATALGRTDMMALLKPETLVCSVKSRCTRMATEEIKYADTTNIRLFHPANTSMPSLEHSCSLLPQTTKGAKNKCNK